MFRKKFFTLLFTAFLVLAGGAVVFAQTAPVTGRVEMVKADNTKVPVEGALVEVFRTDIKSSLPSDKTNRKGEFSFAGLPLGATFVLSVSAPGAKPGYLPNVKAGNEKLLLTLSEGDGRRWTEAEIREAIAGGVAATDTRGTSKRELTAEEKKAQAEHEAKVAEVQAKNEKALKNNEVIQKALADGNAAYNAKDYTLAVAKYEEGVAAEPDFAGSAPVLLNNKGASLTARAVDTFNKNAKATDPVAKAEATGKVKKDLADAADAYNRSWTILKAAQPGDIADPKVLESTKLGALRGAKETFRLMAATEQVDGTKTEIAKALIPEFVTLEPDAAKKSEAQTTLGDVFRVAGDFDSAIVEYRKALELSANNPDALAGLGLSLFASGEATDSTEKKQEGLNYMQKFTEVAPATHKLKDDVASVVEYLKSQKLAPQKVTSSKKKN